MALTEPRWQSVAFRRRLLLALLVLGQTAAGVWLLTQNVSAVNSGWPAAALIGVFAILFTWIGLGFWTAVFGFVMLRRGGDPLSLSRRFAATSVSLPIGERVALVMPICHEPVQRTLGNLNAVCQDLDHRGLLANFDVYVLSDSQEPETWLEEQAACADIDARLGGGRLFYRRRRVNLKYKSGNIADFLRRWGARYRYMVVLDADSLLSAEAIQRLLGLMEQRPQAGIIQTAPGWPGRTPVLRDCSSLPTVVMAAFTAPAWPPFSWVMPITGGTMPLSGWHRSWNIVACGSYEGGGCFVDRCSATTIWNRR